VQKPPEFTVPLISRLKAIAEVPDMQNTINSKALYNIRFFIIIPPLIAKNYILV
jgi:hypothetical protein